jgi:hypothetical protein
MKTKSDYLNWAQEKLNDGYPRQVVCSMLLDLFKTNLDTDEMEAVLAVENDFSVVMLNRNLKGIELEKAGRIDEAIYEYEANIKDEFVGSHPYERLRIIYTRLHRYDDAIRVCAQFILILKMLIEKGAPYNDTQVKVKKFEEHIRKLRGK